VAETKKRGYYTQDTGDGDVYHFFMGDEPPLEQYILHGGMWEPLIDPWFLMDMVIDGQADLTGPFVDPPEGVTPISAAL
jgi:hypothetical protein